MRYDLYLVRPDGELVEVQTGSFGALFIDFNVDGDPKKARGQFKTIAGTVIDPPAPSPYCCPVAAAPTSC